MQHVRHLLLVLICATSISAFGQWVQLGSDVPDPSGARIYGLAVPSENVIWGLVRPTTSSSRTYTRSTDGGTTFASGQVNGSADSYNNIHLFALNGEVAYLTQHTVDEGDEAKIFRTTNGGQLWQELAGPFNDDGMGVKAVHFFDADNGVAFGGAGTSLNGATGLAIYTTSNGGNSWATVNGLPALEAGESTWTDSGSGGYEAIGNTLWFGSTTGRVWKTTDQGATWTATSTGLTQNASSVAFKDANSGIVVSEFKQAARTTDGGTTWQVIAGFGMNLDILNPVSIEYVPGSEGTYVLCDGTYGDARLGFSNDDGTTWALISPTIDGMVTIRSMDALVFTSTTSGFGGSQVNSPTLGGVYEWDGAAPGLMTSIRQPAELGLSVYPNPTRDRLTLRWTKGQGARFELTDLSGRLVKSGELSATQTAELTLNDVPAGAYFLRLSTDVGSQTLKVLRQE